MHFDTDVNQLLIMFCMLWEAVWPHGFLLCLEE